jgi:hypothetical protein
MSSITSEFNDRTKRAYLAMRDFNNDIFTYTTSLNTTTYATEGTLSAVSGATALNCPQGRFLYENGRKLFPGANPGINTYMVGVFDPVSFLSGYIDPNSEAFTLMNTDKPVDMADRYNVFGTNPNGSTSDLAQPVYTRGDVILNGKLIVDAAAGSPIAGVATLVAGAVTVSTTAVTANSVILVSHKVIGGTQGILRTDTITPGVSFTIESNSALDTSTVSWLIIN